MIKNRSIEWWMGIILSVGLLLIIGVYCYSKVDFLMKGVRIKADIVQQENSSLVQITGNAKNSIHLNLNGREIFIDKEGNFSELISLLPGFSIISINAEDKFGKLTEKQFKIISNESAQVIALGNETTN